VKEHVYYTYIVCSRSGTLYIGMTNSIYRRAMEHKRGEIEGFASKYHCDRLVYYEKFDDVHKAIGREKQLKGWRRARKIALIESVNPRWDAAGAFCWHGVLRLRKHFASRTACSAQDDRNLEMHGTPQKDRR
jgi:putative endonuclease